MCGRYQRRSDKQKIAEAFRVGIIEDLFLELPPTYNAAPQSMLLSSSGTPPGNPHAADDVLALSAAQSP
jgi:putative SOS response-associated peptidase YedK